MMVIVLEDAAEDIESGRRFYESCEAGVGDYFAESILSDLDSLVLYDGRDERWDGVMLNEGPDLIETERDKEPHKP